MESTFSTVSDSLAVTLAVGSLLSALALTIKATDVSIAVINAAVNRIRRENAAFLFFIFFKPFPYKNV